MTGAATHPQPEYQEPLRRARGSRGARSHRADGQEGGFVSRETHPAKRAAKAVARALCLFLVFPVFVAYRLAALLQGRAGAFYGFSQLMSLLPGQTGNYLRHAFYRLSLARLGEDACICFLATLSHPDIEIGRNVYVGPSCNLGLCTLGDDVLLGTGVHVMSGFGQHRAEDLEVPIRLQGGTLVRVSVGEDCWIGNRSVVGADVGRKSVVGAASLVTRPIPAYSLAYGAPAKVARDRRAGPAEAPAAAAGEAAAP